MAKRFLALAGLTLSFSANAAIIDLGNITRDTGIGLDWLDVTATRGLSYDQVAEQLGVGGVYEGWRYAAAAELDQLITDFGYVAQTDNCSSSALYCDNGVRGNGVGGQGELVEDMIRTLGDTYKEYLDSSQSNYAVSPAGAGYTYGILGAQNQSGGWMDVGLISDGELINRYSVDPLDPFADIPGDSPDRVYSVLGSAYSSDFNLTRGSFLVKVSPVPIPASGWLFMSALIGLVVKKRAPFR